MSSDAETFVRQWLGAPYRLNGRSLSGVDCYGLVLRYYRDVLGIELPDWEAKDSSRLGMSLTMDAALKGRFKLIGELRDNAIIVVRRRIAHHMGVHYKGHIFHTSSTTGTVYQEERSFRAMFGSYEVGVPDGC